MRERTRLTMQQMSEERAAETDPELRSALDDFLKSVKQDDELNPFIVGIIRSCCTVLELDVTRQVDHGQQIDDFLIHALTFYRQFKVDLVFVLERFTVELSYLRDL